MSLSSPQPCATLTVCERQSLHKVRTAVRLPEPPSLRVPSPRSARVGTRGRPRAPSPSSPPSLARRLRPSLRSGGRWPRTTREPPVRHLSSLRVRPIEDWRAHVYLPKQVAVVFQEDLLSLEQLPERLISPVTVDPRSIGRD